MSPFLWRAFEDVVQVEGRWEKFRCETSACFWWACKWLRVLFTRTHQNIISTALWHGKKKKTLLLNCLISLITKRQISHRATSPTVRRISHGSFLLRLPPWKRIQLPKQNPLGQPKHRPRQKKEQTIRSYDTNNAMWAGSIFLEIGESWQKRGYRILGRW